MRAGVVEELLGLQCALIRVLKIQYAALAGGAECALKRAWVAWCVAPSDRSAIEHGR